MLNRLTGQNSKIFKGVIICFFLRIKNNPKKNQEQISARLGQKTYTNAKVYTWKWINVYEFSFKNVYTQKYILKNYSEGESF